MAERRSNLIDMRFVVVPAVIGLAGFKLQKLMQPIYGGLFGLDYDPAYAYLLNGLSLLQGYVPGHVDHPGTPLQALSAAVIFLAQLFGRISGAAQNDIELVLNSPEYCLQLISSVLLLLNGIAIFFLGRCIHATSGSTLLAIIAQCSYFLLHGLFPRLLYVSPEALVLFSGTMAAACLSGYILGQSSASTQQVNGIGKAVAVGFFLALGVTSKVTFFPLLLLVLLLPNTRLRILGGVSFIVSVAVCLAPIVPAIGRMINWFSAIATHSGHYGEGPREFVRIEAVLPNILSLLTNAPLLTAAVVVCVGVMTADAIRHRKGCESRHSIFVGGIFLAVLLGEILLVSKHYYLHYALPAISICPIVLIWAGNRMHQMIGDSRLLPPILASVLGFVVLVSFGQMLGLIQGASARAIVRDDELSKLDSELKRHPGALVVGHYRVRSKGYGISFGVGFVSADFGKFLAKSEYDYASFAGNQISVPSAGAWLPLAKLNQVVASGRDVLLIVPKAWQNDRVRGETLLTLPSERIIKLDRVNE